ncbi:MAG: 50S ribosomal protein L25/general stress protein Ctc [Oscillospiraceae bacterium]
MYQLTAETRNETLKAKQLRASGMVPGNIYGGGLPATLLIQIPRLAAAKLLRVKAKGGSLLLNCGGEAYQVLLQDISTVPLTGEIQNLSFQSLLSGEVVTSAARVVLQNEDKVSLLVQQLLAEISYQALPCDLIDQVEIDVADMAVGSSVTLGDLAISKNEKIKLLLPLESVVLNLLDGKTADLA